MCRRLTENTQTAKYNSAFSSHDATHPYHHVLAGSLLPTRSQQNPKEVSKVMLKYLMLKKEQ